MKAPVQRTDRSEINLTAMIDVVFLLLVFFIWTSSFDPPELDLPGEVAMQKTANTTGGAMIPPTEQPPRAIDELVVRIDSVEQQTIYRIGETRFLNQGLLLDRMKEIVSLGVQPLVILDPSDTVPMSIAIEVLDSARLAGFSTVVFAVDR